MHSKIEIPTLETDTFLLRPMQDDDSFVFSELIAEHPSLMEYSLTPCRRQEEIVEYVTNALIHRDTGKSVPYTVLDKRTDQIVGTTRFYDFQPKNKSTLLGYTWYKLDYQGSGVNTHCKYLLLDYAFSKLQLERVEFRVDTRNVQSIAALNKLGAIQEGVLRNHLPVADGTRRDTMVFSILKQEWTNRVQMMLLERMNSL